MAKTKKKANKNKPSPKKKTVRSAKPAMGRSGIIPLADRVLVKPFAEGETNGGKKNDYGIIIPDTVSKEKSAQGKVIAVGDGRYMDSKLVPVSVKAGDVVCFSKYAYDEVEYKGEEYYLLKEENILAVIK